MLNLSLLQQHWIVSLEESEMQDFFQKVRMDCLQQLNVAQVNEEKGHDVQHQVAALHKLEKAFISFRQKILSQKESSSEGA